MSNAVSFTVTSTDGSGTVSLVQDAVTPDTLHGTFNGAAHDLTGCTASADGAEVHGGVRVLLFTDEVKVQVSPKIATISIENYGDITGAIEQSDFNAIVAFVLACRLPLIA